ncbi:TonB-dependent receptor, partial [Candidatus Poribacteria bacterium]|nr:TonB-dependent receptor [Candidatus Poribacteria bacterium]
TLKDVLITYVPGMTFVQDQNEVNVAARGIFGSAQQKMLVMLDGHRLNNRSQSLADPDYSISLEKIKQIEVLRGPASSLYGNVALTAVINLVTKSGKDVNGALVSGGTGNNGQQKLSFIYGKEFTEENDLLIWGTSYRAGGEIVEIPKAKDYSKFHEADASAILDGFKDLPSYDVGVKYRFGHFTLLGSARYSKYIEPFSAGGENGQTYKYDEYRTLFGLGPGQASQFSHLGLKYDYDFSDDFTIQAHGYYDQSTIQAHVIIDPFKKESRALIWNDRDLGFVLQLKQAYRLEHLGEGNIILGTQLDGMEVYDSQNARAVNGKWIDFKEGEEGGQELLDQGRETIYSSFSQLKHRLNDNLILNLGLRYDYKDRNKADDVQNLGLRLALIYLPNEKFETKVSYAQSFVDAAYWYRYNSSDTFRGGSGLSPERLNSFQITPTINLVGGRLKNTLNFFYNDFSNFIFRDNNAIAPDPIYKNTGGLKSWGLENEVAFLQDAYTARANLTYQEALDADRYPITNKQINNVPKWTANAIFDFNPFYSTQKNTWFNLTARYIGKQSSPIDIVFKDDETQEIIADFRDADNEVGAALIFNAGFSLRNILFNWISLDARVYNLLDTEYEQGGSVRHPYPQPGRWFLLRVTYHLN